MRFTIDFLKRSDMVKLLKLVNDTFSESHIADILTAEERYDINEFQWIVAKDDEDEIIGYLEIFHISEDVYDKFVNGLMTEDDFNNDNFVGL